MNDAQLVAGVNALTVGWTKWEDRRPVDYRVGFVAEGFKPPKRTELDNREEKYWPKDGSGKPRDPWQFSMRLPLVDLESGEKYLFETASGGGRDALGNLAEAYADHRETHESDQQLPLIELNVGQYDHPSYGQVFTPQLDILKWIDPPEQGQKKALPSAPMEGVTPKPKAEAKRGDDMDMDDGIPF